MTTALAIAASTKRVLLLASGTPPSYRKNTSVFQVWKTWNHAIGCEREHPECFFQPASRCSLADVHNLMVQGKLSYLELGENIDLSSVPPAGQSTPRVIIIRGKHSWLSNFRKTLPVADALRNLGLPESIRMNHYFASSNRYVRNRIWTMQAAVYLLRLNKVRLKRFYRSLNVVFLDLCFSGSRNAYSLLVHLFL